MHSSESPETNHDDAVHRLLSRPATAEDLGEQTRRVASPRADLQVDQRSAVLFELAGECLALPAERVLKVRRAVPVHGIPHRTNRTFRGMCNIDGSLVLCGDLGGLIGLEAARQDGAGTAADRRRLVVIGEAGSAWAFVADVVHGLVMFTPEALKAAPMTVGRAMVHYSDAVLHLDSCRAALLNTKRVVDGFEAALK